LIIYHATRVLGEGITWEDFFSTDSNYNHITIYCKPGIKPNTELCEDDGWIDILLDANFLTIQNCQAAIERKLATSI